MKLLTIFTPSFNRANTLPRLYDSLKRQRREYFIWLIVDDGSTDDTFHFIREWQQENIIDIEYIRQENGGKMRAHNRGVAECKTPLFICVDSDDYLSENAVFSIVSNYSYIKDEQTLCGLLGRRKILKRPGASAQMPDVRIITIHELYNTGYIGDTSIVFKTDVIKRYPFYVYEDEKFMTEAYSYQQIDQSYSYMVVDEAWIICEYQEGGYTEGAQKLFLEAPKGWALYYAQNYKLYASTIKDKLKYMGQYISSSLIAKRSIISIVWNAPSKIMGVLSLPVGFYYYQRSIRNFKKLGLLKK